MDKLQFLVLILIIAMRLVCSFLAHPVSCKLPPFRVTGIKSAYSQRQDAVQCCQVST